MTNRALFILLITLAANALILQPVGDVRLADGEIWCNDALDCAPVPLAMPIFVIECNCIVCKVNAWWMTRNQLDLD